MVEVAEVHFARNWAAEVATLVLHTTFINLKTIEPHLTTYLEEELGQEVGLRALGYRRHYLLLRQLLDREVGLLA